MNDAESVYEAGIEAGYFDTLSGKIISLESDVRNQIFQMYVMVEMLPATIHILNHDNSGYIEMTKAEFKVFFARYSLHYMTMKSTLLSARIKEIDSGK